MKKFFLFYLIGLIFVCSIIYSESIYDVFTLRNMGNPKLEAYFLTQVNGYDLAVVYDELEKKNAQIEIIKQPIRDDEVAEYDIYDTSNNRGRKILPVASKKIINYYELQKDDFIDSTGVFKTNLNLNDIREISLKTNINIQEYNDKSVSYIQVVKDNLINIIILVALTQIVYFIYTISRMKINAVKKLNGYSTIRMIIDSLKEFSRLFFGAGLIILIMHIFYYYLRGCLSLEYTIGLVFIEIIIFLVSILLLLITNVSIRFINIPEVIKNRLYTYSLSIVMTLAKIILLCVVTVAISIVYKQYIEYKKCLDLFEEYRSLNSYFTSNGYNSDEYDLIFSDKYKFYEVSEAVKSIYNIYTKDIILIDANITEYAKDTYLNVNDTSFSELNDDYMTNYVTVNTNYYKQYMNYQDENGAIIDIEGEKDIVLIPSKYKGRQDVMDFCITQYESMINNDSYYMNEEGYIVDSPNIIYIEDDQVTPIIEGFLLDKDDKITNSIVFIDKGNFAGSFYLDEISKGKMAFDFDDRDEYKRLLIEYNLDSLLSPGTMLTQISDELEYYEFVVKQSSVFSVLFFVTLIMIIYFADYLNIVVSRKKYAIRFLMGVSYIRNLLGEITLILLMFSLILPFHLAGIYIKPFIIGVIFDGIILLVLYERHIVSNISNIMKGE